MSAATTSPPTSAPRTRDRDTSHSHHHSRSESERPWTWALAESLAHAGAAFDPAAALAARRLARIRDQELHTGRG